MQIIIAKLIKAKVFVPFAMQAFIDGGRKGLLKDYQVLAHFL